MASTEKRGNSWRCTVRLPGGDKMYATRDTKAEAEAWGLAQERMKKLGQLASASNVLVQELFDSYAEEAAGKTDSAKWNKLRIASWGRDPIVKLRVAAVTTHDINGWIVRRGLVVSPATVNRELNLMSGAFTYAVKVRRWLAANPCHGAQRPPRSRPRGRPLLTTTEIALINAASGYDDDPGLVTATARAGAAFLFALETGMRSGEILRLRPADYMRDAKTMHVAAIERGGRKSSRSGMSSQDPSRHVPLTDRAIELVDQLMVNMPARQPYIVGLSDQMRDTLWRKARDRSGIEDLKFHDSKHEAATRLSPYLDLLELSHALGTKDLRLLRDTYFVKDASRSAAKLPSRLTPA